MPVYKVFKMVPFDGIQTVAVVDVSGDVADARQGLWTFYDLDGSPIEGAVQITGVGEITLRVDPVLQVGSYTLVGLA